MVTPFGTYCYSRLVMGYINATAEFQRHTNAAFGELLVGQGLTSTDRPATAGGLDRHYTGTEQATEVRTSP